MKSSMIMAGIETVVLALPRRSYRKQTDRKLDVLESTLRICEERRTYFEAQLLPEIAQLFAASQFCLILEADISVFLCEMMCAKKEWARCLYARHLALVLIEGAEDTPQVLGKKFRESLNKMVRDQTYLNRLNQITKMLSEFRRKHEKELREIRNMVAAHRDLEARNQMTIIKAVDTVKIKTLASEFTGELLRFTKLMIEILQQFSLPNMVKGKTNFKLIVERLSEAIEKSKVHLS